MARRRQLTPSTTGSRVDTTLCCPLSPLPSHTVPALRRRSWSVRCIAAHLQPAHKAMGDEGFAAGTDSSCGWSSAKGCGCRVRARSLVHFLLSPFSWAVFAEVITTLKLFLQQQFLHAAYMRRILRQRGSISRHVQLYISIWCNDSQQKSQELLWHPCMCSSSSYSPSEVGEHAPVNLGQSICCVPFYHSARSILVISGHSHQRCWRVLSPSLSADRGLVLSQKAQGEKHDMRPRWQQQFTCTWNSYCCCLYSVWVDTCTRCPLLIPGGGTHYYQVQG